jgi:hypothetical protein
MEYVDTGPDVPLVLLVVVVVVVIGMAGLGMYVWLRRRGQ